MKRIFTLLLALLMIASCFIACEKEDDKTDEQNPSGDNVVSTSGEYVSKLPDDMDWGGETYLTIKQDAYDRLMEYYNK